ncbi:GTPase IMAP family member 7 [Myxocyprinus asiaticus]|uniref:GTPase IMAP family member 7 n=1 Tax=Myxocyprinus asiaticus TaxID=70543 RepID=UPI00222371C5|nr:GTPase IMAP family member 7 [Myxocyprinus asiaticus]XP_051572157.1 GTPase IMAP family member 7 [Myxocyprinus asiaticus]XP_051572158.1 GTPase IMAP family member 7 [Myxocyprinus asiaticus]XP_051572160.1 GTPase IMAP family member 7 [Myxocyprinus asiaticus]
MATDKGGIRRRWSLEEPPYMSIETPLRMLVFGSSSLQQISLTHSVLGPGIFTRDDVNITATKKSSRVIQERNITLVNTPNLGDNDLPEKILYMEFKKAVCFSCPGPHAALLVLDTFHLTSIDLLKPVIHYFGERILKHTLIVLYHEKGLQTLSIEDEVKKNKIFRELAEKCGQNYLFFNEEINRTDSSQTKALLAKVDEMVLEHDIYSNLEFKDAEKRIQIEERFIRKSKEKEFREKLKALENEHSGEALDREIMKYEERVQLEGREIAELLVAGRLGFTLRLVDYAVAIGKGAFIGALLGFTIGYEGMAVGAAVGAGLGGIHGGAANAAWSYIASSFADVRRGNT